MRLETAGEMTIEWRDLDAHLHDDLRSSRAADPADWTDRGLVQRVAGKASEVVSG